MFGGDVAPDRSTLCGLAGVGRGEWHNKNVRSYLGDHQPVSRRDGRVEQRVGLPDFFEDIIDTKGCMFEQVSG